MILRSSRYFLFFGTLLPVKSQRGSNVPPSPHQSIYKDTTDSNDYSDFFGESNWNDFAGLWIDNNDYLSNNYDYVTNMDKASEEHKRQKGYVKDPRVPEQPGIVLHPNPDMRVSHTVKVPPLPPGIAYQLLHCVAQSSAGPVYKLMYNRCLDHFLDAKLHSPSIAFGSSRLSFRLFKFQGVPGGFGDQDIRYVCKLGLCPMHIPGACRSNRNCAPPPPPPLPLGQFERARFMEKGYRGINNVHMAGSEFQPFGGYVQPETIKVNLKSDDTQELKRTERYGFNLHVDEMIYKTVNTTVILNGTETYNMELVKSEPVTSVEIKLGIARHLYKTGVDTVDLQRMRLINGTELEDQPDFEEMKEYYDHSHVRHQRKSETKQQFRRRLRKVLKTQRRTEPNYITKKDRRRGERLRARMAAHVEGNRFHLSYDEGETADSPTPESNETTLANQRPQYEDEPVEDDAVVTKLLNILSTLKSEDSSLTSR